jgi:hypothetical protein
MANDAGRAGCFDDANSLEAILKMLCDVILSEAKNLKDRYWRNKEEILRRDASQNDITQGF